jgi:type IV pilus assembly protein PilA
MCHELPGKREDGFTLIELLVVVAIIAVLASLAVAQLIRARAAANEASQISSLRAITSSQIAFANSCGAGAYATDLTSLGGSPGSPAYLSPDLTTAAVIQKSGYQLTLTAGSAGPGNNDCNGQPTSLGYYASSEPVMYNISGSRSFAVNADGTVWQDMAATAPTEPFGAPASPIY